VFTLTKKCLKNNLQTKYQEVIGLKIKNEAQGLFLSTLFTSIGPLITTLVALIGALLGLRNCLGTRKKERVERAANDLKGLLTNTADDNARLRIVGVVGLQHFFTPGKKEYHLHGPVIPGGHGPYGKRRVSPA
jgi:hypothetical protein